MFAGAGGVVHHRIARRELQALLRHAGHVFTGNQRRDGKAMGIVANHIEGTATDRAG